MIISHAHQFIFIKTTKTAGTSVEIALTRHCGDEDVITPIHPDDEAIKRDKGLRGPQNDELVLEDGTPLRLFNHAPAMRAQRAVGPETWERYFTFAFERNPFDRAVSAYHYVKKNRIAKGTWNEALTFDRWVGKRAPIEALHARGWGLYAVRDKIAVDKIYKYEELNAAMAEIYDRLGITDTEQLMQTKTSVRKAGYQDYYSDPSRAIVAEIFEKELDTFGYVF